MTLRHTLQTRANRLLSRYVVTSGTVIFENCFPCRRITSGILSQRQKGQTNQG